MATSSPHKEMMVLSLQQLEGNLLNLERDRVNLITAIPFGPRTSDELPFEVLLREADQCCKEQGEILLYITRLTLTPGYYERPHRLQRLLYLLDSLMHCIDIVIDSAERLDIYASNEKWSTKQKTFLMARKLLSSGRDMVKLQQVTSPLIEFQSEVSSDNFRTSAAGLITKSEYLLKQAPYTWDSTGQHFVRGFPYPGADSPEAVGAQEPYIERTRAIYSIVWVTPRPLCKEAEYLGNDVDHSNLNSVWLSPMTDSVFDKSNQADYVLISSAVLNSYSDREPHFSPHSGYSHQHPLILAEGLRDLEVEVGVIFADDPSVTVWPLGKRAATAKGSVIVHCTRTFTPSNEWSYKVLRPCASESESDKIGLTDMRLIGQSSANFMTPLPKFTASCNRKPRPGSGASNGRTNFFDLPPELRNIIYKDCIELPCPWLNDEYVGLCWANHDHSGERRSLNLAELGPTALCRTSRQARDEILPLVLASKFLKVNVSPSPRNERNCWSLVGTRILTTYNKWLSHSPNTAYLRSIEFRGTSSTRPTFRVWIQLMDNSSKFKLTTDRGVCWEPGKAPGGYNLPALVRIIMLDKQTVGLSMADVACIADFLGERYKRWTLT